MNRPASRRVAIGPPNRGDVYLIDLDPTRGSEIRKSRPCVVVSPNELNHNLRTVVVSPMTTGGQPYPWRVVCEFGDQRGMVAFDQLRTVDRERLVRHLGVLESSTFNAVLVGLAELFAP